MRPAANALHLIQKVGIFPLLCATFPTFSGIQHGWTVSAKEMIPMSEVGSVVKAFDFMMGLVMGGTAEKGKQSVWSQGQVVPTVVLHCQPAVEQVEDDFAERMAAQQPGTAQRQQQQRQQLCWAGVLRCERKGVAMLMMRLVDAAVQPGNPEEIRTGMTAETVTAHHNTDLF